VSYVQIKGFEPDADPSDPGILTDCDGLIPTLNGVTAIPSNVDVGVDALASAAASAVSITNLDGTIDIYAASKGTAATSVIYKLSGNTWGNISAAGGTYSANTAAQWTFAQYGDTILAAQLGDAIQATSSATASFHTMSLSSGSFKARIIETVLDFAVAFNLDDTNLASGTYGVAADRWICSAAGNVYDWATSIATQSTSGRLTDYPGPITAGKRLGSNLVAYKRESMFFGQYVGAPEVWRWRAVPGEGLGTWGPYSVVNIETAHIFWGFDNAYLYDGTRPIPIATNRVASWFFDNLNIAEADKMVGYHDRQNFRVYWFFPSSSGPALDRYIAYNYRADRWTQGLKNIQTAFEYLTPSRTYDGLNDIYSATTYNDLPTAPYDNWQLTSSSPLFAVFDTANKIQTINGTPSDSSFTTGVIGTDDKISLIDRVRPRFRTAPSVGTQTHITLDVQGGAETTATMGTSIYRGGFDHVYAGRWHKFKHSYSGNMEIVGVDFRQREDSEE